jgi:TRAP-type C4-dicarboxylate transport system permease small subunit
MIWMVMVGMIVVTANRSHIALDFLVTRVAPRRRIALSFLHHIVMTGACGYATVYCWSFVMRVAAIGQTSMALELPMAIPHFALVVGFGGTTIASALLLAGDISELLGTPRPRPGAR